MTPTTGPRCPTDICARLREIPDYDRDRVQLHQPRGRRPGPPPRGRAEGAGARRSCAGRSARPKPRRRRAQVADNVTFEGYSRRLPGLTRGAAAPRCSSANTLRGLGGAKPPATARREGTAWPTSPCTTAWPRSPPPTGTPWPAPNRPTGGRRRPLHHPPLPVGAGGLRLHRHRHRLAGPAPGRCATAAALLAATPLYVKTHSQGEYIFDHGWADALERAGGPLLPQAADRRALHPRHRPPLPRRRRSTARRCWRAAIGVAAQQPALLAARHLLHRGRGRGAGRASTALLHRITQQFHWENRGYAELRRLPRRPLRAQAQDDPQGTRDGAGPRA